MKNAEDITQASVTASIYNVPVGTVMPFMGSQRKLADLSLRGWHHCNGDLKEKDIYPELFDMLEYTYGGSGATFALPDMRGVFVRGVDAGRGQDPDKADRTRQGTDEKAGDTVGSYQNDEFKSHNHSTITFVPLPGWVMEVKTANDWCPPHDEKKTASDSKGGNETRPKNISAYHIIFTGLPNGKPM